MAIIHVRWLNHCVCALLVILIGLLVQGTAYALVAPAWASGRYLQSMGAEPVRAALSEQQVRQLMQAPAAERARLISSMAQQLIHSLERVSTSRREYPEPVVAAWLSLLLERQLPPSQWNQRLEHMAGVYVLLDQRMLSLVRPRLGVDDPVIMANQQRLAGRFAEASEALVSEIDMLQKSWAAAAPDEKPLVRLRLAQLLLSSAMLADLNLDAAASSRWATRLADLQDGKDDLELAVWLLISSDSLALLGHHDLAQAVWVLLDPFIAKRPASGPTALEWQRLVWVAKVLKASQLWQLGESAPALAVFLEAKQLGEAPGVNPAAVADLRQLHWLNLLGLASLESQATQPVKATAHAESVLQLAQEEVDRSGDEAVSWVMLGVSEYTVARSWLLGGELSKSESHLRAALRALERQAFLGGDNTEVLQAHVGCITALGALLHHRRAWPELLEVVAQADKLTRVMSERGMPQTTLQAMHHDVFSLRAAAFNGLRDVERGLRTLNSALAIAQRQAEGTAAASEWNGRLFDSHMQLGRMEQSREGAVAAAAQFEAAINLAQRAVQALPDSEPWQSRLIEGHEAQGDKYSDEQLWSPALQHWQMALELSAAKVAQSPDDSTTQQRQWRRLFYLGRGQVSGGAFDKSRPLLIEARDLALRFTARLPEDPAWREFLWYSQQVLGTSLRTLAEMAPAEAALEAARDLAIAALDRDLGSEAWAARAMESLDELAATQEAMNKQDEARRTESLALTYRQRREQFLAPQYAAYFRKDADNWLSNVAQLLGENSAALSGLPRAELLQRLQSAIDTARAEAQDKGLSAERSRMIIALQNALFAWRNLPD